jgi:hypothetical protein
MTRGMLASAEADEATGAGGDAGLTLTSTPARGKGTASARGPASPSRVAAARGSDVDRGVLVPGDGAVVARGALARDASCSAIGAGTTTRSPGRADAGSVAGVRSIITTDAAPPRMDTRTYAVRFSVALL